MALPANESWMSKAFQTRWIVLISIVLECFLFYLYYFPEPKLFMGDEKRYFDAAVVIANGGDWHTHPLWPPMQSVLLAFFIKFFNQPLLALQIFQYGLLLLSGFIVRDMVWRETQHAFSSQVALAVMLLYPSWLAYSHYLWPEVVHVLLFVAILWINQYKYYSYRFLLFSGALLGLALLFKSLLVLFVPVLYWPVIVKLGIKKASITVGLSLVLAGVVMAPASIKAHQMTGSWMVSNSSMFNLWFGLKDKHRQNFTKDLGHETYLEYMNSAQGFVQRNKIIKEKALNKIQQVGYLQTVVNQLKKQYFRLFDYQSFFSQQFQGDRQDNYLSRYYHRADSFWVSLLLFFNVLFYLVLMSAMFMALWIACKSSLLARQLLLFLLYLLALFVLLHTKPRFRIPLVPLMAFFSAYLSFYIHQNNMTWVKVLRNKAYLLTVLFSVMIVLFFVFSAKLLDIYFPI